MADYSENFRNGTSFTATTEGDDEDGMWTIKYKIGGYETTRYITASDVVPIADRLQALTTDEVTAWASIHSQPDSSRIIPRFTSRRGHNGPPIGTTDYRFTSRGLYAMYTAGAFYNITEGRAAAKRHLRSPALIQHLGWSPENTFDLDNPILSPSGQTFKPTGHWYDL